MPAGVTDIIARLLRIILIIGLGKLIRACSILSESVYTIVSLAIFIVYFALNPSL